jgi:hypothetical protein
MTGWVRQTKMPMAPAMQTASIRSSSAPRARIKQRVRPTLEQQSVQQDPVVLAPPDMSGGVKLSHYPMDPATTRQLQHAIERLHGGKCRYVETVQLTDEGKGKPIWSQAVHVFSLEGHPTTTHAYVWAEPVGGVGPKQQFTAVLQEGPIESPLDAIRASIIGAIKESERR